MRVYSVIKQIKFQRIFHKHVLVLHQKRDMEILYGIVVLYLTLFCSVQGEINCYCNEEACKTNGYTCNSVLGGCYSQFKYNSNMSLHGCLDLLPVDDQGLCNGEGDILQTGNGRGRLEWPILMCCKDDMCNYIESTDINIYINGKNKTEDAQKVDNPSDEDVRWYTTKLGQHSYTREDTWFRAAVIAVPIAGGFILVLLVLLAVRMLRGDQSRRHHQRLIEISRRQQSLTKAQIYVFDHFNRDGNIKQKDKNNTHSINNDRENTQNRIYKDISIKIEPKNQDHGEVNRGLRDSSGSSTCESVLIWGKEKQNDDISPV